MVCSFVGFDVDVFILLDFLYVFVKFCLEIISSSVVGFEFYLLDYIEYVIFKFIEGVNVGWWVFRFKFIGFFIVVIGVVVL